LQEKCKTKDYFLKKLLLYFFSFVKKKGGLKSILFSFCLAGMTQAISYFVYLLIDVLQFNYLFAFNSGINVLGIKDE